MADRDTYPSPTAAQARAGAGPFYSNGDMGSHDGNKDHLSHGDISQLQLSSGMDHINPDLPNGIHVSHADAYAAQAHEHQALAQSVMSLQNHHHQPSYQHISVSAPSQSNAMDAAAAAAAAAAAKQRSKVSRACDECRRKKACNLLQRTRKTFNLLTCLDSLRCNWRE
jgi:hypothetical protein